MLSSAVHWDRFATKASGTAHNCTHGTVSLSNPVLSAAPVCPPPNKPHLLLLLLLHCTSPPLCHWDLTEAPIWCHSRYSSPGLKMTFPAHHTGCCSLLASGSLCSQDPDTDGQGTSSMGSATPAAALLLPEAFISVLRLGCCLLRCSAAAACGWQEFCCPGGPQSQAPGRSVLRTGPLARPLPQTS